MAINTNLNPDSAHFGLSIEDLAHIKKTFTEEAYPDVSTSSSSTPLKVDEVAEKVMAVEGDLKTSSSEPKKSLLMRTWICLKNFFRLGLRKIIDLFTRIFKRKEGVKNQKKTPSSEPLTVGYFTQGPNHLTESGPTPAPSASVPPRSRSSFVMPPLKTPLFAGAEIEMVSTDLMITPDSLEKFDQLVANLSSDNEKNKNEINKLKFGLIQDLVELKSLGNQIEIAQDQARAIQMDQRFNFEFMPPEKIVLFRQALTNLNENATALLFKYTDPDNKRKIVFLVKRLIEFLKTESEKIQKLEATLKSESALVDEGESKLEAENKGKKEAEEIFDSRAKEALRILKFLQTKEVIEKNSPLIKFVLMLINHVSLSKIKDPSDGLFERSLLKRDPRGLYNIGNSCYINAGIKLLMGILPELVSKDLKRRVQIINGVSTIEEEISFKNRKNLQASLRSLLEALKANKEDKILSALYGVRFALYIPVETNPRDVDIKGRLCDRPALNPDFLFEQDAYGFSRQHDGAIFISVVLDALDYSVPVVTLRTVSEGGSLHTIPNGATPFNVLTLTMPLRTPGQALRSFQDLLSFNYGVRHEIEPYRAVIGEREIVFTEYDSQARLLELPENLFFQIARFQVVSESYRKEVIFEALETLRKRHGDKGFVKGLIKGKAADLPTIEKAQREETDALIHMAEQELGVSGYIRKISEPVLFPKEGRIDLAVAFGSENPIHYQITSFEVHLGRAPGGGHYKAFMLHEEGTWWEHDDEKIKPIKSAIELDKAFENAYNVHVRRIAPAPSVLKLLPVSAAELA